MLDDFLIQVFGEPRWDLASLAVSNCFFRMFFGLIGAILGIMGAVHFAFRTGFTTNSALRVSIVLLFVFLASFSLFNIVLARKWRWPALFFVLGFVSTFLSRILFGA